MTEDWGNFELNESADIDTSQVGYPSRDRERGRIQWPAAIVAVVVLLLIGGIFITAVLRWGFQQAKDLLYVLSPVIGVIVGASITYFFTRTAAAQAFSALETQTQRQAETLNREIARTARLHNALTATMAHLDPSVTEGLLRDQTIRSAFEP